jgi:hypothetical protein
LLLLTGLSAVLLAAGFTPTPLFPQYFFAPVPFMILAFFTTMFPKIKGSRLLWAGVSIVLVMIIFYTGFQSVPTLMKLPKINDWVPNQLHDISQKVKNYVPAGKVLTLAPIIPLEVGLNTYSPFIVGPFSWRTAQFIAPALRQTYGIISPDDLDSYLRKDPPSGILLGMEAGYEGFTSKTIADLEVPFEEYARANDYQPVLIPCNLYTKCTLWIKNKDFLD